MEQDKQPDQVSKAQALTSKKQERARIQDYVVKMFDGRIRTFDHVLREIKVMSLPSRTIGEQVMSYGDILPDCSYIEKKLSERFSSILGKRGADIFGYMLCHQDVRNDMYHYFKELAKKGSDEWLAALVNAMPVRMLSGVLFNVEFELIDPNGALRFKKRCIELISDTTRREIVRLSMGHSGLAELHELTGWPECLRFADDKERALMLQSNNEL